ncbi:restriction endonuclease [Streptomyces kronopolitis]|uniref:restriction endonuclease n=1 Tax=Streptomyces kronopolitis TaxID=1612435 RepID=UPI0020C15ADF|nr:restriction endonuclease [Streptomyces kronopolitis]MCL6299504.1 restriction endonuclease [Streptomyces kronopolitis]
MTDAPSTRTVPDEPGGAIEDPPPLDREAQLSLVKAVLAWTDTADLRESDLAQIALQLTEHARIVAADLRRRAVGLPEDSRRRVLVDVVLAEADRRLSIPARGTVACCQNRARLVRALHERLDRLADVAPQAATAP